MIWRLTLAILVTALLVGCDKSADNDPPGPTALNARNNSAVVNGDQIGTGQLSVAVVRAELPLVVQGSHPDISLGQAYKARSQVDTTDVYWLVKATNDGDEALSGITAGGVAYLDANGLPIEYTGPNVAKLYGNVGVTDLGCERSCLAPGESGWFLGRQNIDYDDVASMRFSYIVDGDDTPTQPEAVVRPTSYTAGDGEIEVEARNTGSWVGVVGQQSAYVILDVDSTPLFWGTLPSTVGNVDNVESGEDIGIRGAVIYHSSGWKAHIFIDYADMTEERRGLPTE